MNDDMAESLALAVWRAHYYGWKTWQTSQSTHTGSSYCLMRPAQGPKYAVFIDLDDIERIVWRADWLRYLDSLDWDSAIRLKGFATRGRTPSRHAPTVPVRDLALWAGAARALFAPACQPLQSAQNLLESLELTSV